MIGIVDITTLRLLLCEFFAGYETRHACSDFGIFLRFDGVHGRLFLYADSSTTAILQV